MISLTDRCKCLTTPVDGFHSKKQRSSEILSTVSLTLEEKHSVGALHTSFFRLQIWGLYLTPNYTQAGYPSDEIIKWYYVKFDKFTYLFHTLDYEQYLGSVAAMFETFLTSVYFFYFSNVVLATEFKNHLHFFSTMTSSLA